MRILVACEFSGRVRDAFCARGHDAWSCDLEGVKPEGKWKHRHYTGDVRQYILGAYRIEWDLMIAHPPCTYLANSGLRWLWLDNGKLEKARWSKMKEAAAFFRLLMGAPIPRIAVENPIMHHYGQALIGRHYSQLVQPWEFGDGETKGTCLWLKGLSPLVPTKIVEGRHARVHLASGKDKARERSITPKGIAKAMAAQWG